MLRPGRDRQPGVTRYRDPLELCRFLPQDCVSRGVQLHRPSRAVAVRADVRGELSSVRVVDIETSTETDVPCTRIIITAGAWSRLVFRELFPNAAVDLPISSLAGHSLVVQSPRTTETENSECHALFATDRSGFSPEIFSRLGGHVYIAGLNSASIPLPKLPGDQQISRASISQLADAAKALVASNSGEEDLEVVREGLCFRPVTPWGSPIVSRIADEYLGGLCTRPGADGGVFVAAGHGPWGISLSLGTAMVLAEMAQGRMLSADVGSLAFHEDHDGGA